MKKREPWGVRRRINGKWMKTEKSPDIEIMLLHAREKRAQMV